MYFRAEMKNTILSGLLFLSALFQTSVSKAQISQGGKPRSFSKIASFQSVPVLTPGRIDIAKLQEEDAQRRWFAELRQLLMTCQQEFPALDTLSMGMSADLTAAILEGSTLIRVGTALFGERLQSPT